MGIKFGYGKGDRNPIQGKGGRRKGSINKKEVLKEFLDMLIDNPKVFRNNGLINRKVLSPSKMSVLNAIDLRMISIALYGKPLEAIKARELISSILKEDRTPTEGISADEFERRLIRDQVVQEKLKLLTQYKIEEPKSKKND